MNAQNKTDYDATTCWLNEDCIAGYHGPEHTCRFPSWTIVTKADFVCTNPSHARAMARLAAIEVLVASAEYRERTSLSRTFGGGSFGAWVDAKALRAALGEPPTSPG